jgi:hypothetical protein
MGASSRDIHISPPDNLVGLAFHAILLGLVRNVAFCGHRKQLADIEGILGRTWHSSPLRALRCDFSGAYFGRSGTSMPMDSFCVCPSQPSGGGNLCGRLCLPRSARSLDNLLPPPLPPFTKVPRPGPCSPHQNLVRVRVPRWESFPARPSVAQAIW